MKVLSSLPGRVRWHIPLLRNRPMLARRLSEELAASPGITSTSASALTGNVLVLFDPAWTRTAAELRVAEALERASAASLEPAPGRDNHRSSDVVRLFTRIEPHRPLLNEMILSGFLNRLLDSSPSVMIGAGIDIVTRGRSSMLRWLGLKSVTSQLFGLGAIGLGIWAIDAAFEYRHRRAAADLANLVRHELRNDLYAHLQRLDVAQIESRDVSSWINLIDGDLARIHAFIKDGSDPMISMVANGVAVAAAAFMLSPTFALAQVLLLPPVMIASKQMLDPLRGRLKNAGQAADRLSALVHGNLSSLSTINSFGAAELEERRVAQAGDQHNRSLESVDAIMSAYVPVLKMIAGSSFMTTLVYGGILVNRGALAPGAYNIVATTQLRLLAAVGQFGLSLSNYQRTSVSLDRVLRVLDMQPAITTKEDAVPFSSLEREIAFDNVSFGYEPDRLVLRSFRMRFPARQTVGIVGSSGAGKSTVLKLLVRFYDVSAGAVRYDHVDVRDLRLEDLHRHVAMVSQEVAVFPGTIRDNIAYARPDATDGDVRRAAEVAEAHEFISALPDGYRTQVGYGGLSLSAGQRQRIAIARVVLADRPILLFDEATSALDYKTEASIQRSLREITAGRTTVIVAHRLSTIRHADLIYVLDDGSVKEVGRHDDLIAADGIYAAMWKVQTGEIVKPSHRH